MTVPEIREQLDVLAQRITRLTLEGGQHENRAALEHDLAEECHRHAVTAAREAAALHVALDDLIARATTLDWPDVDGDPEEASRRAWEGEQVDALAEVTS